MRRCLVLHQDTTFSEATIYLSGHAYRNCRFERCAFVLTDAHCSLQGCVLICCTVHLNLVLFDQESLKELQHLLTTLGGALMKEGATSEELPSPGLTSWPFGDS